MSDLGCIDGIVYFGSNDKGFYALDAETGRLMWRFQTKNIVLSPFPVTYKTYVYFSSWDRGLYCLDKLTGELKWVYKLGEYAISGIRIYDGILYVGSMDKNLYAINAETGELARKFPTKDMVTAAPAFKDGVLFFGSWDCCLYAITTDGKEKWKFTTSNPNPSPVSMDPVVFESKNPKFVWKSTDSKIVEAYKQKKQDEETIGPSVYGSKRKTYIGKNRYAEKDGAYSNV